MRSKCYKTAVNHIAIVLQVFAHYVSIHTVMLFNGGAVS